MAKYRNNLPQLDGEFYLADGGIETTLIFLEGFELPEFASFYLFNNPEGETALHNYFQTYAKIANQFSTGLILESATWRASTDWGKRLSYTMEQLAAINRKAIQLLEEVRKKYETIKTPIVISGCLGPRGDGYIPSNIMSELEAERYHQTQIQLFSDTSADMVSAITMNYVEEAIGIAQAAKNANMPVVISFTVETNGALPSGQGLRSALEQVDEITSSYPSYFMINCAHPTHFEHVLAENGLWLDRIRGIRANSSCKSHAELNESSELDIGNVTELGRQYASLKKRLTHLNVMGGCCGTDHRHIEKIAETCLPLFRATT